MCLVFIYLIGNDYAINRAHARGALHVQAIDHEIWPWPAYNGLAPAHAYAHA